jgi:hypothetical protein
MVTGFVMTLTSALMNRLVTTPMLQTQLANLYRVQVAPTLLDVIMIRPRQLAQHAPMLMVVTRVQERRTDQEQL